MRDIRIVFDASVWDIIEEAFGVENARCEYCGSSITKDNIGGITNKLIVCNNLNCLFKFAKEESDE